MSLSRIHNQVPRRNLLIFAAILFVLSYISAYYFQVKPSVEFQQKLLERYVVKEQKDANALLQDSNLMRKLVLKNESLEEFERVAGKNYGVFLFAETISDNQDLLFWNNQKILPPIADFSLDDGEYFQQLSNGYYIIQKTTLKFSGMSNNVIAYVLIPILNQYYLETNYLLTRFAHNKEAVNKISLSNTPTLFPITSVHGKRLFYIKRVAHVNVAVTDTLTIVLRLAALIFLLFYIHLVSESIVRRSRALYGWLFLVMALVLIRAILYIFPEIFSFRQFQLFDPAIYATNWLNRSLGDLLINALIICWLVLFAWYNMGPVKRVPTFLRKGKGTYIAGIIAVFILVVSTFQIADIVRGLVSDSKISFNVTDF
ncbi:MAG: hypothetical protein ACJ748_15470, partial [Flavisolibacter sp.]